MKYIIAMRALILFAALAIAGLLSSCEQETYEPATSAMPGGGTVSTYKAYTLGSSDPDGANIYGRVVFYKYSTTVTLVQMGLYNTTAGSDYVAMIFDGAVEDELETVSHTLDKVDGASGAFATYKYFTIEGDTFYDNIDEYNANVRVLLDDDVVAAGDIGANAPPVLQQD